MKLLSLNIFLVGVQTNGKDDIRKQQVECNPTGKKKIGRPSETWEVSRQWYREQRLSDRSWDLSVWTPNPKSEHQLRMLNDTDETSIYV